MCRVSGFVPKSGRRFGEKTVLTRKQNELLLFINKRLNEAGVSPSFDEMKEALRLKSKSGIHRLITGLEERGFLRRLPHRARALQVLKLPEAAGLPAPNVTPLLDSRRGMAESREGLRAADRARRADAAGRRHPGRQRGAGAQPAALRPDRRRHADRGAARQLHDGRRAGVPARLGRALLPRGAGRFDGRGRHPRTATSPSSRAPTPPNPARSSWPWSTTPRRR